MIGRAHHLNDDRLFECYLAARDGESVDLPADDHLSGCGACQLRYAELTRVFDDVRDEAENEADEVFTPQALRHQQEQILRRIEHGYRAARVISFPRNVSRHIARSGGRVAPRWLAAAAVAGLFVGGAVGGMFIEPGLRRSVPAMRVATSPLTAAQLASGPALLVSSPAPVATDSVDDDVFLEELEFALERPHTRELQPFDALTPHVREIGSQVR